MKNNSPPPPPPLLVRERLRKSRYPLRSSTGSLFHHSRQPRNPATITGIPIKRSSQKIADLLIRNPARADDNRERPTRNQNRPPWKSPAAQPGRSPILAPTMARSRYAQGRGCRAQELGS